MRVILATNGSRAAASDRAAVRRRSDRQQGDVPRDRWRAGLRVRRPRAAHGRAARRAHLRPLHMLPLTAARCPLTCIYVTLRPHELVAEKEKYKDIGDDLDTAFVELILKE
ncbi:hypothetical protein SFRURICE_017012 [Spodoptera frugiperda]|uniref:SFRICE_005142 n=1 Tax=Spodoptera frugiperda TaxID=7108 RepID=A0A2H1V4B5_SPOFR|nr:hypothetical protein SFRURICE_017012 [Spodoptera frugiperda]